MDGDSLTGVGYPESINNFQNHSQVETSTSALYSPDSSLIALIRTLINEILSTSDTNVLLAACDSAVARYAEAQQAPVTTSNPVNFDSPCFDTHSTTAAESNARMNGSDLLGVGGQYWSA
jgi:hypothetical protein